MSELRKYKSEDIPDPVLFQIFNYIHPQFHSFIFPRALSNIYAPPPAPALYLGRTNRALKMPIGWLFNSQAYTEFKDTLLGKRFKNILCQYLAGKGNLTALQWARAQGCQWDEDTCSSAAEGGHLQVLKWARAEQCPWSSKVCEDAAWMGHKHIIQWARRHGCPWSKKVILLDINSGD